MKILIADDHPLVREGLCNILKKLYPALTILEASDYQEVSRHIATHDDLDLILLDLFMPGASGVNGVATVRQQTHSIPLVVISSSEKPADIQSAIDNGANGFITKSSTKEILATALQLVMAGGLYIPPQILLKSDVENEESEEKSHTLLTDRQREVLKWLAYGDTNKEIGRRLSIAEKTVKAHLSSIFEILEVSNRTQAVRAGIKHGIIADLDYLND